MKRNCYCGLWEKDPATLERQGIPRGYCGLCQRCGKPGHTQHFPGPVPYTGAWCDRCVNIVRWTHPVVWIQTVIIAGIVALAVWNIWKAFAPK